VVLKVDEFNNFNRIVSLPISMRLLIFVKGMKAELGQNFSKQHPIFEISPVDAKNPNYNHVCNVTNNNTKT